jgi:hypothetical protein
LDPLAAPDATDDGVLRRAEAEHRIGLSPSPKARRVAEQRWG